jgi:hypothetical protein
MNSFCEFCCEARNFWSKDFTLIVKTCWIVCSRYNFLFNRRNFVCSRFNSLCNFENRNVNRERFTNNRKVSRICSKSIIFICLNINNIDDNIRKRARRE